MPEGRRERNEAKKYIYEDLHEKKQRMAMSKEFERLQEAGLVSNELAGTYHEPKKTSTGKAVGDPDEEYSKAAERNLKRASNSARSPGQGTATR